MNLKRNVVLGLVLFAVACLGCDSGPEIASVEGTVTMDGEPLEGAAVVFVPEQGRPAGARTDEQGHYVLTFTEGREGALLGTQKIRITTESDPYEDEDGNMVPAQPETVPTKYNAETELKYTVKEGENIADFDLESEGELPAADTLYGEGAEE